MVAGRRCNLGCAREPPRAGVGPLAPERLGAGGLVYATGEQTCAMFVDHYRKRKTGPCYPVAVVGCRVHGKRRYTLYPAGHYPYGRVAVVAYSAGEELLWEADRGRAAVAGDAVRCGAGCAARADVAVRAELVATLGCAPAANARTAVGDGWSADRSQWEVGGAGARADRDAVGSGDHDRVVGSAPLVVGRAAEQRSWRCWWR